MHIFKRIIHWPGPDGHPARTTGCGSLATISKLEDGAGAEASRMWDRWVEGNGDIAVATTWERKVKPGMSASEVEEILKQLAVERNMRDVGTLPLSKELEARSGKKEKLLTVYSFAAPTPPARWWTSAPTWRPTCLAASAWLSRKTACGSTRSTWT
jgi:hypothetical protein